MPTKSSQKNWPGVGGKEVKKTINSESLRKEELIPVFRNHGKN